MRNVLVVGGNRGIGLELARQLAARGDRVTVTCREPSAEVRAVAGLEVLGGIDVATDEGIARLAKAMEGRRLDWLVLAAGMLEANPLEPLDVGSIRRQFEVNALAPIRIASAVYGCLPTGGKIGFLSSRMGSIGDNTSGGHYGYRMSKAALNAAAKSLAHDLAPRGIAVAILHPGFVRTTLTRGAGLIDPDESARLLIGRLDALTTDTSGEFRHANGELLPW